MSLNKIEENGIPLNIKKELRENLIDEGIQTNMEEEENEILIPRQYIRKRTKIDDNGLIPISSNDNKMKRKNSIYEDSLSNIFFRPINHGSLRHSVFALICVTLGTGMLPLPYFFKTNGIILTLLLFILCSFPTYLTLQQLIAISYENECYSYESLVSIYFGNDSFMVKYTIIVLLINSFGSIISWNVFISQFSQK